MIKIFWIPAFAGMTDERDFVTQCVLVYSSCTNSKGGFRRPMKVHSINYFVPDPPTPFSLSFAWAAAIRAMGTRKGEQLT